MGKFESTEVRVECGRFEEVIQELGTFQKTGKTHARFSCVLKQLPVLPKVGHLIQIEANSFNNEYVFRVKEVAFVGRTKRGAISTLSKIVLRCEYLYTKDFFSSLLDFDFPDAEEEED